MLTIFANMRINDRERLQHMKDSFESFQSISDDWLINVRGNLREEAIAFLKERLGGRMTLFELLDDSRGWMNNALDMLAKAKFEYVLVWNEDHICQADPLTIKHVVAEMQKKEAEYLLYSWWVFGGARFPFEALDLTRGRYIDTLRLDRREWSKVMNAGNPYLISLPGIFRKDLFRKLLLKDRVKLPFFFNKNLYRFLTLLQHFGLKLDQKRWFHRINGWLRYKIPRFPKEAPFNLEKGPWRTDILPFTIALPKQELFACVDDDLGTPGYSLVKRGLYPKPDARVVPVDTLEIEKNSNYTIDSARLLKGGSQKIRYYEDVNRLGTLPRRTIILLEGSLHVQIGDSKTQLNVGQTLTYFPNVPNTVVALSDSQYLIVYSSIYNKHVYFE